MMVWHSDRIDLAFIFNGRGGPSHDEIRKELEDAIEKLSK